MCSSFVDECHNILYYENFQCSKGLWFWLNFGHWMVQCIWLKQFIISWLFGKWKQETETWPKLLWKMGDDRDIDVSSYYARVSKTSQEWFSKTFLKISWVLSPLEAGFSSQTKFPSNHNLELPCVHIWFGTFTLMTVQ